MIALWNKIYPNCGIPTLFLEKEISRRSILSQKYERDHPTAKKISLLGYLGRIAAAAIFLLLISLTGYLYIDKINIQTAIAQMYTISAEKGERASVTLPDGTKVYLNAKSTLSYPASFSLNERTVQLTGEAYFEVKHDADAPFIVKTAEIQIKVLGTTFNLYAYPDDSWFEASLVEGSIEVTPYKSPGKQVHLSLTKKPATIMKREKSR